MTLHVLQVVRICSCIFADFVCNNLRSCCQTSHCSLWQVDSEGLHPSAQLHCNAWCSGRVCVTSGSEFMCDELLTRRVDYFFRLCFHEPCDLTNVTENLNHDVCETVAAVRDFCWFDQSPRTPVKKCQ